MASSLVRCRRPRSIRTRSRTTSRNCGARWVWTAMSSVLAAAGAARIRLTPEQREELGRLLAAVLRLVVRMGWTWGTVTVLGVLAIGTAVWTAPTWWPALQDWFEQ